MKTEVVANGTGYRVNVTGLDKLMKHLARTDPEMRKAIKEGLKEAARPVLARARANAMRIADDGTYANSMAIKATTSGTVKLVSTDPAAGVKEYAKRGARYVPRPNDKRRNARKMPTFPVGVPRGNPPRAMIPAVEDSVNEVSDRIAAKLEEVLRGVGQG